MEDDVTVHVWMVANADFEWCAITPRADQHEGIIVEDMKPDRIAVGVQDVGRGNSVAMGRVSNLSVACSGLHSLGTLRTRSASTKRILWSWACGWLVAKHG